MLEFDLYNYLLDGIEEDFKWLEEDCDEEDVNEEEKKEKEVFKIKDLDSCNWVFRKIKMVQKEIDEVEEFHKNELKKLNEWKEKEVSKKNNSIEYFKSLLIGYLLERRKENPKFIISTPIGKFSSRKNQDKYVIKDKECLISWLKENGKSDILKIKEDVNISDIKKEFSKVGKKLIDENSGEVVPYLDIVESNDSYILKFD